MKISVKILPALLCLAFTTAVNGDLRAEDVPTSVKNQTAEQFFKLIGEASAANMIITDFRTRKTGNQILYNATFAENTEGTAWIALVNVPRKQLDEATKDYESKGYTVLISRSASAGGKRTYTAVWIRKTQEARGMELPPGPLPISGPQSDQLKSLDEMLLTFLKKHNVAGATVAIAKDGRLLYARGFGYADVAVKQAMQPHDVMRIASISKPITGVAVMMLIQEGKLSLDDKIVPLLVKAGHPKPTGDKRWRDITVRHLVNHTGGWDRGVSEDPMFQVIETTRALKLEKPARQNDILRRKLDQPLDFDPGQRYVYSNFGYCVLGRVIEAVSGRPYHEFVAQRILKPAGMQKTRLGKTRLSDRGKDEVRYHMQNMTMHAPFWVTSNESSEDSVPTATATVEAPYGRWDLEVMDAHGGWTSTAADLLRFVKAIDDAKVPLLNENSRKLMVESPKLRERPQTSGYWYGCGWSVRPISGGGRTFDLHNIWHNGALAGTSTLLVRRRDGYSWAVLFNTDESSNGSRLSGLIDPWMHTAVDAVKEWPDRDLFDAASPD